MLMFSFMGRKKEGFWGNPGRTFKLDKEVAVASSYGTAAAGQGLNYYSVPGDYQYPLAPRFSNTGYGPNARTEMQNVNAFLPASPSNGCVMGSCGPNGKKESYTPGYTEGNFNAVATQLGRVTGGIDSSRDPSILGGGEMQSQKVFASGETESQPIIFDRLIFANTYSRLRNQGDPIRGDLPITPHGGKWFTPSVKPNIDLRQGAMDVIGGTNNNTSQALSALMNQSSGFGRMSTAGVPSYELGLSGAQGDIEVRAFP